MELRDWFESLDAERVEALLGRAESQVFDCKRAPEASKASAMLATIVSGFANAEGGVCLWGVDARKDAAGIDCVSGFPGIDDPVAFAARIDELTPHCVSPGVPGVKHRALPRTGGAGFVASFVPASEGGPHMAKGGEDRYYQRIGQAFLRMEHFQIADMFGRRARPALVMSPVVEGTEIRLRIANAGRGSAQAPYVRLKVSAPFTRNRYGVDGNGSEHLPFKYVDRDGSWIHAAGADVVIHPGTSLLLGGAWLGLVPSPPFPRACTIDFELGALGVPLATGSMIVPIDA